MLTNSTKPFIAYKSFTDKYASAKVTVVLVGVTLVVYAYILLVSIPAVASFANDMDLFDMKPFGYSVEYARSLLDSLGEEGRREYLTHQIPADMVYPLLFALSFSFLLSFLFRKLGKERSWPHWLIFVPVVAGLFDYFENLGIILMLNLYPDFSSNLVGVVSAFTVIKSLATMLFWLTLTVTIALLMANRVMRILKLR